MKKLLAAFASLALAACTTISPRGPAYPGDLLSNQETMVSGVEVSSAAALEGRRRSILFFELEQVNLSQDDISARIVEEELLRHWTAYSGMTTYSYENRRDLVELAETLDPGDMLNLPQAGNMEIPDLAFKGTITKDGDRYYLALHISEFLDARATPASDMDFFTKAQIDDRSAPRIMAIKLLERLGRLTSEAYAELSGNQEAADLEAKGLVAEQSGNHLAGLSSFLDSALLQGGNVPDYLVQHLLRLSRSLENPREDLGLDELVIEDHENWTLWEEVLAKTEAQFAQSPPYQLIASELETSGINYESDTASVSMDVELVPSEWFDILRTLQMVLNNLPNTPEGKEARAEWGFDDWPRTTTMGKKNDLFNRGGNYHTTLVLRNERGKEIGRRRITIPFSSTMSEDGISSGSGGRVTVQFTDIIAADLPDERDPILMAADVSWQAYNFITQPHKYDNHIAMFIEGGPRVAGGTGGLLGFNGEVRYKRLLLDLAWRFDLGTSLETGEINSNGKPVKTGSNMTLDFGAAAVMYGGELFEDTRWLLSSGLGGRWYAPPSKALPQEKAKEGFKVYWKTQFDVPIPIVGMPLVLRAGYTMQFYPAMEHVLFAGVGMGGPY